MGKEYTEKYIKDHIKNVQKWVYRFAIDLLKRGNAHDLSKLEEPEFSKWCEMDREPRYRYGTPEYFDKLKRFKSVIDLHHSRNRHHPEYFKPGINDKEDEVLGQDIIDLIEQLCDMMGYKDNITYDEAKNLIDQQCERYNYSPAIKSLLRNTISNYFVSSFNSIPEYQSKGSFETNRLNILA